MKHLILLFLFLLIKTANLYSQNVFSVEGNRTLLNESEFQAIGVRCANALLSDETVDSLIYHLDEYKEYGLNTISVFFMGSRYSNIHGYNLDGSLNSVYQKRMAKLIESCDRLDMVVLVGILYWGSGMHGQSHEYYSSWRQEDVNNAIRNTMQWLTENKYRNVFVDPDNEGMAERGAGFDIDEMICEGKKINSEIQIGYNGKGYPPPCADLAVHFGFKTKKMPYIQTEGTPKQYWGEYSKEEGKLGYINVGIYTPGKKAQQLEETKRLLDSGHGYLFSSTWLQDIPPRYDLGGAGIHTDPGIRWWFDYIKNYLNNQNQ